jgi:basic membrane lipoprotein Med (substrate-binding protein (PBP1-ABC) superfamily)
MPRDPKLDAPRPPAHLTFAAAVLLAFVLAASALLGGSAAAAPAKDKLKVFGAYATPIEEPWDGVIHAALTKAAKAGAIDYTFTDDIGYSGNMERVLRQVAGKNKPDVIFGDAFGNEEAVRRVAKAFPQIAFVFGSAAARPARTSRCSTTGSTSPPTCWACSPGR